MNFYAFSRQRTAWFTLLNDIRKKVKHPVGKVITEKEYLSLLGVWERIKPKIDASNDDLIT